MQKICSIIKLSYSIFLKHIGINVLLALQICVCILAINYSHLEINRIKNNIDLIQSIDNQNTLFVMIPSELRIPKKNYTLNFETLDNNYRLGEISKSIIMTDLGATSLFIYNDAILSNMTIPLSKGNWYSKIQNCNGEKYYPIIVNSESNGYKYGDYFRIGISNNQIIGVYIAGVLNKEQQYISLATTTNSLLADHLVGHCKKSTNVFFCNKQFMPDDIQCNAYEYCNKILFLDNSLDLQQSAEIINQLKNQAYIESLDDLLYNSNANVKMHQGFYGPLCACLCIVCFVGILSFSILLSNRNIKTYSNIILCGGTKKDCLILSFLNVVWVSLLSVVILVIVCNVLVLKRTFAWESISISNIAITISILTFVNMINYAIVFIVVKSKPLIRLVSNRK